MKKIRINNGDIIHIPFSRDKVVVGDEYFKNYHYIDRKQITEFLSKIRISGEMVIDKVSGSYIVKSIEVWQDKEK